MAKRPYVQIQDKHGAVASIYIEDDNLHKVQYTDNTGCYFYTELFQDISPEFIEQSVMDWAEGKRSLA